MTAGERILSYGQFLGGAFAPRRLHWVATLIGVVPALFADLFFNMDGFNILTLRPNPLVFSYYFGYLFIILLLFNISLAREHAFKIRSISSLHLLLGTIISFSSPTAHTAILCLAYLVSCAIAICTFVVFGRISNIRFLLVTTIFIIIGLFAPFISLTRVILAITILILARLVAKVFQENVSFVSELGPKMTLRLMLISFFMWLPFGAIIWGMSEAAQFGQKQLEDYIYESGTIDRCPDTTKSGLRYDIDCTIEQAAIFLEKDLIDKTIRAAAETKGEVSTYPDRLFTQLDKTIEREPAGLKTKPCKGFLPVGCWIANSIRKSAMRTYQAARAAAISKIYNDTVEAKNNGINKIDNLSSISINNIPSISQSSSRMLRNSVKSAFDILDILSLISNIFLIAAICKSYLYIFARIAYQNATQIFIKSISRADRSQRHSVIRGERDRININIEGKSIFYKARSLPSANFPPSISVPQAISSPIVRIFSSRYLLDKSGTASRDAGQIIFNSHEGRGFTVWRLGNEESIIVNDLSRMILFEDTCSLGTRISLRLSTLLLGRLIFPTIEGPGSVVFYTSGPSVIGEPAAYEVARYVCWREDVGFNVVAETGFLNTYFSGIQLRPFKEHTATIVDPTSHSGAFDGAIRFLRNFFLPF